MVKKENEIPPDVGINEVSGWIDEITGVDEAWSDSMTYRPVWVRSRPIFRFPVGMLRYSVGVRAEMQKCNENAKNTTGTKTHIR